MSYSLSQAAKATGRSKATIHRAIQSHKISAERDEAGSWRIDPAELHRVFPPVSAEPVQNNDLRQSETVEGTTEIQRRITELQQERERERADKDAVIADLRRRLDEANTERRQTQAQLTALLTDQRTTATPIPAVDCGGAGTGGSKGNRAAFTVYMSDDDDPDWLVERVGPGSSTRIAQYRREAAGIRRRLKLSKTRQCGRNFSKSPVSTKPWPPALNACAASSL